jgi:hypothetical protein
MKNFFLLTAALGMWMMPAAAQTPAKQEVRVSVVLTEWEIVTAPRISAGHVIFQISNEGTTVHSLVVAGQGVIRELSPRLRPGQRGVLEADLEPGDYRLYCPVGNHRSFYI